MAFFLTGGVPNPAWDYYDMDVNDYFQAIFGYFLAVNMFVMTMVYLGLYKWLEWKQGGCKYSYIQESSLEEDKIILETQMDGTELEAD